MKTLRTHTRTQIAAENALREAVATLYPEQRVVVDKFHDCKACLIDPHDPPGCREFRLDADVRVGGRILRFICKPVVVANSANVWDATSAALAKPLWNSDGPSEEQWIIRWKENGGSVRTQITFHRTTTDPEEAM